MLAISLTGEHVYLTRGGLAGSHLALPPVAGRRPCVALLPLGKHKPRRPRAPRSPKLFSAAPGELETTSRGAVTTQHERE